MGISRLTLLKNEGFSTSEAVPDARAESHASLEQLFNSHPKAFKSSLEELSPDLGSAGLLLNVRGLLKGSAVLAFV